MFVTNAFFLAAWDPMTPLKSAIAAGVTNLVLDLFLVNVMHWGIAGAAVATAAAQVIRVAPQALDSAESRLISKTIDSQALKVAVGKER